MTGRKITYKEFEHIFNPKNNIEVKTIKDYHNLYLKCDFLSLGDVFQKFRTNSLKFNGLCRSRYLSKPGLSWDAMFKRTKIKFELIPDPDMYIFFERYKITNFL